MCSMIEEPTAGELLDERLNTLSSGLYALARFLRVSFDDRKPSNPCMCKAGVLHAVDCCTQHVHLAPAHHKDIVAGVAWMPACMLSAEMQRALCMLLYRKLRRDVLTFRTEPHWL